MEQIQKYLRALLNRKKEIFIAVVCYVLFSILIFPYSDLSDLVTEKVAEQTQGQVFLSFDDLGLAFLPPGVNLSEVSVETGFMPQMKMSNLSLAPSIAGLLAFKPGFVARAEGLFGGDVDLTYKTGEKITDELNMQQVFLEMSGTQLKPLSKLANLPLEVRGTGNIEFDGQIDPGFGKQPESEIKLQLKNILIPAGTVPTPLGPLAIPTVKFKKIDMEGRLVNGELIIEKGSVGDDDDDIRGSLTGNVDVKFVRQGNQVIPVLGGYNLKLDMTLTRGAEKNFGIFLSFIDKFKQLTGNGARYPIQLKGSSFQVPPEMSFLRK